MKFEAITETFDGLVSVAEMTSDPAALVRVAPDVVARVTAGDDEPKFATFVIEAGWSKSKRYWGPELFGEVASEINSAAADEPIVGYMGHIKPENDPYSFPEIQLQWVGAQLLGNERLAAKAYILPGTKARDYFTRGIVKSVSWRGKIAQEIYQQGVRVKKFAIESIDLARPRSAGMSARLVGALTSEMTEEEGGEVKPEEIAALQPNELRAHNPGLVQGIEEEARKPLETKVSEMETAAAAVAPVTAEIPNLKKILGLAEDADDVTVLTSAVEFIRSQGKTIREGIIDKVLKSRKLDADNPNAKLARRIIVGEMAEFQPTGDAKADETVATEMVNRVIDGDEQLKEIVSEMEGAPPAVSDGSSDNRSGQQRELKPGLKTSTIRVRSLSR